ncbi:MAG TPA: tRNA (guanosine(46)-N7)-methyltransferase TrmB [Propionibacteriaceae bacterium]|nr:tRNA (guanosine(46)-N7)-methyltransferase TrmB [Propionibacteriaceae bacterium]
MTDLASTATDRTSLVRREVVSFVRRSSRMRVGQRRAWEQHRNGFVIDVPRLDTSTSVHPDCDLDLDEEFGRQAPLIVEVGPGTGESLVPMARARPECNILAFEVYQPAIAKLVSSLASDEVSNVRVIAADAVAGIAHLLPERSLDELWTFFPDPWPKARHHKRRLIQPAFADLVASRLKYRARWRLATDWPAYAEFIRGVLDDHPGLVADHEHDGAPRWACRPPTRFEQRGVLAGRPVIDLTYRRVS